MRRNCNCRCSCNRNYNWNYKNSMMNSYNMYQNNHSRCSCMNSNNNNNSNSFPNNYLYGHAYTPNQTLGNTFDPQTGLDHGSMFPELVSPYYPGQSMEFIEYLKSTGRNGGCGCE